ncbi:MAG: N-acetyltransferase [Elusimicrobiota bacterium]
MPPERRTAEASVEAVRNAQQLTGFIDLPWEIYRDSPPWVPPLKTEVRDLLTEANPFWQHAERELFLAVADGRIVGRCAAVVDRAYNDFHHEKCGYFGFFECVDDEKTAQALLDAARTWLKDKGMSVMRGPASPSFNEECGLLIEGFDDPPAIMMPYNPPYYSALLESAGLTKIKDLYSYLLISTDPIPKRIRYLAERVAKKEGVRIRSMRMARWEEELQIVRDIYNEAWEKNWGFTPMTPAELDLMAEKLKPIVDPEAIHFADVDGETVAFSILLPDVNQALRRLNGKLGLWGTLKFLYYYRKIDRVRLITLGVRKAFRNRGLEVLLYREAWLTARRKGWDGELGWILEDNEKMNRGMQAMEGKLYKKYRIYERAIA